MNDKKSYELEPTTKEAFTTKEMEDISIKDKDELLARKIDLRISEARPAHKQRCEMAEENFKLFRAQVDEVSKESKGKYNSKQVLSRFFLTIRNMVGLATDKLPTIEMIPDTDNPKSIRRAKTAQDNVDWQLIDNNFLEKLSMALFDTWVKADSYMMWYWDEERDDVGIDVMPLEEVTISDDATNIQDSEFVIYHPYKNRSWWKENYPKQYKNIEFTYIKNEDGLKNGENSITFDGEAKRGNVAQLVRYIEDDIIIEKVKSKKGDDIILRKDKNPFWEWRTPQEQLFETAKKINPAFEEEMAMAGIVEPTDEEIMQFMPELQSFIPITNYLKSPRKNIIQLPSVKFLGEMYSESLIQHAKEVFISLTEKKRAYNDNLAGCNQKTVVDADVFTREEAEKITNEPNQVVRIPFSDNAKPFYIEKGGDVPASFHVDMSHDESYIDDLFGHHAISRGDGDSGTLGQDQMNSSSDRTPIRFQARAIETAMVELTEGMLQLMRMFYTTEHYGKKYGDKDGIEIIKIINTDIEQGISPHIKPGTMISLTKLERANRAVDMFSRGAIDPYTMYVEMDLPNPKELSDRLVNWMKYQIISQEDPEQIASDMSGMEGMKSIERADQENKGIQSGDMIQPTPPELVTYMHVQAHYAFLNDDTVKIDDEDRDTLTAHAEVDKATLANLAKKLGVRPEMVNMPSDPREAGGDEEQNKAAPNNKNEKVAKK